MKVEDIKNLFEQFEAIACEYEGVECWSARELCKLLGYAQWRNFEQILAKAKFACENAGEDVSYHLSENMLTTTLPFATCSSAEE